MIDFRYHLVSLTAVFLAVALGIVVGTALGDPVPAASGTRLQQDETSLEDRTRELTAQLETADEFEQAVAPALVDGTLAGTSVLVVATGEDVAPELLESVGALLVEAGARVNGVVRLQPAYSDPASATGLQNYVTSPGLPAGLTLPETADSGELVGAVLAQTLMAPSAPGASASDTATVSSVLAGLSALGVLTVESSSVEPSDVALVLTGEGFASDAEERTGTLVDLVTALDSAGSGAVVAGTAASAGEDGLVGVIRSDSEVSAAVSTVDNVDRTAGRISTVLALGLEGQGTSGAYGTGEDAEPVPPVQESAAP